MENVCEETRHSKSDLGTFLSKHKADSGPIESAEGTEELSLADFKQILTSKQTYRRVDVHHFHVIAAAHVAQEDRPFLHSARRDLKKLRNLRGKRGVMIRTVTAGQKGQNGRHKTQSMHTRANHLRHSK